MAVFKKLTSFLAGTRNRMDWMSSTFIYVVVMMISIIPKCDCSLYNGLSYSSVDELRYQSERLWQIIGSYCPQPIRSLELAAWGHQPDGFGAFFLKTVAEAQPDVLVTTALLTTDSPTPASQTACRLLVAEDRRDVHFLRHLWRLPAYRVSERIIIVIAARLPPCPAGSKNPYHHFARNFWLAYHTPHVIVVQLHQSPCENWTEPHVWIHYPYRQENPMLQVPASQFGAVETLAMTRRYWNLEGAHIPAVMYPSYPTAMPAGPRETNTKSCNGASMGRISLLANTARIFKYVRGSDHFLRLTLEEKLNAHIVARYPKDEQFEEGEELPNGRLTGALAEMASGQAQLELNLRFVRPLPTPEILFLQPIHAFVHVGIAVARAPLAPLHVAIMRSFDLKVWFSVAACYILSAMIWSLLTSRMRYRSVIQEIQKFILLGCGSFARSPSQKFFAAACAIFSLIIVTIFQGSLVNVLTTPVYDRDINTAEELLQSGLPIATNRSSLIHMFRLAAEGSPVMTELCKRMKAVDKHNLSAPLFERKQAFIMGTAGFNQLQSHQPHEANMLHMIKDTFIVIQRAHTARTDCPVKEQVEKISWYLIESGIPTYWNLQAARSEFALCSLPEDTAKPFSLKQFKIAFYTLCLGLLFSSFVFVLEVINYKRCQKPQSLQ